jgi:hypothetical protein
MADLTFSAVSLGETAGGGTPGGNNTYVQFNDAGALGGVADFTFTKATKAVVIAGPVTLSGATTATAKLTFTNSNNFIRLGDDGPAGIYHYANYGAAGAGHRFYGYGSATNQLKFGIPNLSLGVHVYFNFTDASNYERLAITPSTGLITLAAESAGTGAANVSIALNSIGTGSVQINKNALAVVSTDGLVLQNTTAATAGATVQISPRVMWTGTAWNTTAVAATNTVSAFAEMLPVSSTAPLPSWRLGFISGAGATTYPVTVNSNNNITLLGSIDIPATRYYSLSARVSYGASASGVADILNSGLTGFTRLNYGPATANFPALAVGTPAGAAGNTLQVISGDGTSVAHFLSSGDITQGLTASSGTIKISQNTEATTGLSGATKVSTADLIPAGSLVLGVTVKVVTTITGATTFTIGDGTDADKWGATIALAAGTKTSIIDFTTTTPTYYAAATKITLTATGSNFTAGAVTITVHYISLTAIT